MTVLLIFTFLVLSPWPLFFSYLFYYLATLDNSYNPLIYSKKVFYKHWGFLGFIVILCGLLFVWRLARMGQKIDFFNSFFMLWDLFTFLPYFQGYLLFLSFLIMGIFSFYFFRQFYTYIRRSVMVLYIYYYQFDSFRKYFYMFLNADNSLNKFFRHFVYKFTQNSYLLHYAYGIWPLTPRFMERNLFKFMVPYLYIFDISVKNGMLSLVFYIIPWMFLYSLIRSFYQLVIKIFMLQLLDVTMFFYGLDRDSEENKKYY